MRVLLLHNRYRAEGGEERSVEEIARLLKERGHTAEVLERSSQDLGRTRAAISLWRGGADSEAVERAARSLSADVVHAHNLHPLFGWRALAAGRAAGARVVVHLHQFRLFCAIGVAYRDGAPCFRCRGGDTLPGLRLRCRGSLAESAAYAAGLYRQLPRLLEHADRLVTVSDATMVRLVDLGVPAAAITSLPNFVPASAFASASRADAGVHALVAGRLVPEKGFDTAVRACVVAGVPLVVAGSGPDEARLRALAAGVDGVRFAGQLARDELDRVRAQAAFVLAPSRSDDACPYAVVEALAAGVPVIASDRGGLPELAAPSVVAANDVDAWTAAVAAAWSDPAGRRERGEAALERARARYHPDVYYDRLMRIYGGAD